MAAEGIELELGVAQEFKCLTLELQHRSRVRESEHNFRDDAVLHTQKILSEHRIG